MGFVCVDVVAVGPEVRLHRQTTRCCPVLVHLLETTWTLRPSPNHFSCCALVVVVLVVFVAAVVVDAAPHADGASRVFAPRRRRILLLLRAQFGDAVLSIEAVEALMVLL